MVTVVVADQLVTQVQLYGMDDVLNATVLYTSIPGAVGRGHGHLLPAAEGRGPYGQHPARGGQGGSALHHTANVADH